MNLEQFLTIAPSFLGAAADGPRDIHSRYAIVRRNDTICLESNDFRKYSVDLDLVSAFLRSLEPEAAAGGETSSFSRLVKVIVLLLATEWRLFWFARDASCLEDVMDILARGFVRWRQCVFVHRGPLEIEQGFQNVVQSVAPETICEDAEPPPVGALLDPTLEELPLVASRFGKCARLVFIFADPQIASRFLDGLAEQWRGARIAQTCCAAADGATLTLAYVQP